MKLLFAASECVPFVKVGGLADVVGALPKFLSARGHDVRIIIPKYRKIDEQKHQLKKLPYRLLIPVGGNYEIATIMEGRIDGKIPVYFIENKRYFDRAEVYRTPDGDYADNRERFIFFSRAVLEAVKALNFQPDIIHCHDWQTGIIPAYLKTVYRIDGFFCDTATVYTIHNMAYQGMFDADTISIAGFSWNDFVWNKLEYYGKFNFMKAALVYADMLSTVSPTYAKEIQLSGEGRGMEGILRSRTRDIVGILNGIDYGYWSSEIDPMIAEKFSKQNLAGKKACREDLQRACGLPVKDDAVIIGAVSRLDPQKGYDLVGKMAPKLLAGNVQLVILGTGDRDIQELLQLLAKSTPRKMSLNLAFNEPLAHKIYAGADLFLMPSRFEPCGLGQMIALAYGTIPVVKRTGGLADSIKDYSAVTRRGNGFVFDKASSVQLKDAIDRAMKTHKNSAAWLKLVYNALSSDFSWEKAIPRYEELYRQAHERKKIVTFESR
jgi:starch synthase